MPPKKRARNEHVARAIAPIEVSRAIKISREDQRALADFNSLVIVFAASTGDCIWQGICGSAGDSRRCKIKSTVPGIGVVISKRLWSQNFIGLTIKSSRSVSQRFFYDIDPPCFEPPTKSSKAPSSPQPFWHLSKRGVLPLPAATSERW